MDIRYVSITFLEQPQVGKPAVAAVTEAPTGIWGPLPGFPTNPIPIYPGGTPNPPGIWGGGNEPFPTPPIYWPGYPRPEPPPMGDPKAQWRFQDDGWYFVAGPFPRPVAVPPNNNFDPIKSGWKYFNGWYFVSGPYDKPFPILGVDPPVDPEPPTDVPEGKWVYRDDGWYFVYGPSPKPQPPGNGNGGSGNGGNVPPE